MSAVISDCGRYRYSLSRVWDESKYCLPFCMLNPSTADAEQNDPTIRRCIGFAKREGYGAIHVVNCFAFRATDPKALKLSGYPYGPENYMHIDNVLAAACLYGVPIVCAWGNHYSGKTGKRLRESGVDLVCLGKTKSGYPKHPLYLRADTPLEQWP